MKSSGICKTQINDSAVLNAFAGFLPALLCLSCLQLRLKDGKHGRSVCLLVYDSFREFSLNLLWIFMVQKERFYNLAFLTFHLVPKSG